MLDPSRDKDTRQTQPLVETLGSALQQGSAPQNKALMFLITTPNGILPVAMHGGSMLVWGYKPSSDTQTPNPKPKVKCGQQCGRCAKRRSTHPMAEVSLLDRLYPLADAQA